MANVKAGNTYYIDTNNKTLADMGNSVIKMILLTATSANAVLVLQDSNSQIKFDLRNADAGTTERFNFVGAEIGINSGLKVTTLTNCNATIVLGKVGG